jgi:hypothetical protein
VAPHASDFDFLVATAKRGIDDLRRALHRVRLGENERGSHFVGAAEALLAALEDGVEERREAFAEALAADDETAQASLARALRQITNDIRNVHVTTPWIEAAHTSRLPLGLVYFVDEMTTALLKKSADVIAVPSPQYMYSTIHKPFAPELAALQRDYPAGIPIIVHYPVQELESLLLHLIVAHEIGHSVIREYDLVQAVAQRDEGSVGEGLGNAVAQVMEIEKLINEAAVDSVAAWFAAWLVEAACDALALGYLGPSFLFSMTTFLTPFAGPRPSETHPPSNIRMSMLLRYIDSWGWKPLLDESCPATLEWFRQTADEEMDTQGKSYYDTLGSLIMQLSPSIEAVVADHLGDDLFKPEAFASQADEISAFLNAGILPAQHRDRTAIDRRSILLAGWLNRIATGGDGPGRLPEVVAERDFQAFLAKALEMSAVLERWPETAE